MTRDTKFGKLFASNPTLIKVAKKKSENGELKIYGGFIAMMREVRDIAGHLVCKACSESGLVEQVRRDGAFYVQLPVGSQMEIVTKGNKTKIIRNEQKSLKIEYMLA